MEEWSPYAKVDCLAAKSEWLAGSGREPVAGSELREPAMAGWPGRE